MFDRALESRPLGLAVRCGLFGACVPKALAHPFGDRHAMPASDGPDLVELGLFQEHLQSLTHGMSITAVTY